MLAIIGYDGGSTFIYSITVSLLEVGKYESSPTRIQLVNIEDYQDVKMYQCKIEIHRIAQQ